MTQYYKMKLIKLNKDTYVAESSIQLVESFEKSVYVQVAGREDNMIAVEGKTLDEVLAMLGHKEPVELTGPAQSCQGWQDEGRVVIKGEKASRVDGAAVFYKSQTKELPLPKANIAYFNDATNTMTNARVDGDDDITEEAYNRGAGTVSHPFNPNEEPPF